LRRRQREEVDGPRAKNRRYQVPLGVGV